MTGLGRSRFLQVLTDAEVTDAGFISDAGSLGRLISTPDYPIGVTFTGRAWSEPVLLRLAYAYEQASQARGMPPGLPALAESSH